MRKGKIELNRLNRRGFTLVEIVVVLAVVAILIALITPAVIKYIDEARVARARSDVKAVSAAIGGLIKDTEQYPGDMAASTAVYLGGPGNLPSGGLLGLPAPSSANVEELAKHLLSNGADYNSTGRNAWSGPYINELKPDPWGNKYLINVQDLKVTKGPTLKPVFVLSAGPNWIIDTTSDSATFPSGDDIGIRIR